MRFKLIALDVDGTLLNDNYEVTQQTKETIRRVHANGSRIVLCTGRGPGSTLPILAELGLEGAMITHNGAATVQSDGTLLHQHSFSVQEIHSLLAYCRQRDIHFDVCTPFDMYIEEGGDYEKAMYTNFFINPNLIPDVTQLSEPLVKLTLFSQSEVLDVVQQEWDEHKLYGSFRMIRSGDLFIDVMNSKTTKGNALKQLAAGWGIEPSEILAIGNYYNDLEMLEFAGLGIAMENSPEEVKIAADKVTLSNNEDGVHEALLKYCL